MRDGSTNVTQWRGGRASSVTARRAGARENTAKAIVTWRSLTDRAGAPFGDAATRRLGLETAGRLQADLGLAADVVFFGGASGPDDAESTLR